MFSKFIKFGTLLFIFSSRFCYCSEADQAKDLLAKMADETRNFSADVDFINGESLSPVHMKWYKRTLPDGEFEFRLEAGGTRNPLVLLNLSDGLWSINRNLAIHMAHLSDLKQSKSQYLAGLDIETNNSSEDAFSVAELSTNNNVFYIVTEELSEKNKQFKKNSFNAPKIKEILSKYKGLVIPSIAIKQFIIDKTNGALDSYSEFGEDKRLIVQLKFRNFKANTPLADDLFKIPQGIRQVTTKSIEEHQALLGGDISAVMVDQPSQKRVRLIILGCLTISSVIPIILIFRSKKNE